MKQVLARWMRKSIIGGGKQGPRDLAESWTKAMWSARLWRKVNWLGMEVWQWPTDLLVMQELIFELKPKVVLETGTARGGSSIFYASILHLLGGGRVISVDIRREEEVHKRVAEHKYGSAVTLITADSKAPETIELLRKELNGETNVLVVLDADHGYEHVLGELRAYREFVPVGGYMVVFDTICEALGKIPGHSELLKDNPLRSVREFLVEHPEFEVDLSREKLLVSLAPHGFLRRKR